MNAIDALRIREKQIIKGVSISHLLNMAFTKYGHVCYYWYSTAFILLGLNTYLHLTNWRVIWEMCNFLAQMKPGSNSARFMREEKEERRGVGRKWKCVLTLSWRKVKEMFDIFFTIKVFPKIPSEDLLFTASAPRPIQSSSRNVRLSITPKRSANIGIPLDIFAVLPFWWFFAFEVFF